MSANSNRLPRGIGDVITRRSGSSANPSSDMLLVVLTFGA